MPCGIAGFTFDGPAVQYTQLQLEIKPPENVVMEFLIEPLQLEFYEQIIALWRQTSGLCVSASDSREGLQSYLERNANCSFMALSPDRRTLWGTLQAGHDRRSGYFYHLAVAGTERRRGIGSALVAAATEALRQQGLTYIHLLVETDNPEAVGFWRRVGFDRRDDLVVLSRHLSPE